MNNLIKIGRLSSGFVYCDTSTSKDAFTVSNDKLKQANTCYILCNGKASYLYLNTITKGCVDFTLIQYSGIPSQYTRKVTWSGDTLTFTTGYFNGEIVSDSAKHCTPVMICI